MARLVGINHVALEIGDVGEALECHGRFVGSLEETDQALEELRRKGLAD